MSYSTENQVFFYHISNYNYILLAKFNEWDMDRTLILIGNGWMDGRKEGMNDGWIFNKWYQI